MGLIPILVLAIIPNPFFDLAGIAAGTLKMPVWQFLLACLVGKTIKMVAFAYAGAGSHHHLLRPDREIPLTKSGSSYPVRKLLSRPEIIS